MSKHPFYGKEISANVESEKIEKLLAPFRGESPTEELKKKIYQTLSQAKESGEINTPFKVVMRAFPNQTHRDFIEVIIDTKL